MRQLPHFLVPAAPYALFPGRRWDADCVAGVSVVVSLVVWVLIGKSPVGGPAAANKALMSGKAAGGPDGNAYSLNRLGGPNKYGLWLGDNAGRLHNEQYSSRVGDDPR